MEWFLKVVRDNYANFEGRARRKEYWMFALFSSLISIALTVLDNILGFASDGETGILSGIYSLAVFIPGIAVAVRRLHDVGKSGWMLLLVLLPIIGWIWLFVLYVTEGQVGDNEYGPDPKGSSEFKELGNN
jgi:uncharacterized membrane protein YhaH (DUF805 family)